MKIDTKITTVLFDLDGTLRQSVPSGFDIFLKHAASIGLVVTEEHRLKIGQWTHLYWANSECLVNDQKAFSRETDDFWQNYAKRQFEVIGISSEQAKAWAPDAQEFMKENFKPEDVIPDDVYETLQVLKESDYKTGLVTNRRSPIDDYLVEKDLKDYFDFYFTAGEINSWKPQPKIFYHALKLAQAEANETVYVGDNYYADILGARNVDMIPVLIDPEKIFPEADCLIIQKIGDLQEELLKQEK